MEVALAIVQEFRALLVKLLLLIALALVPIPTSVSTTELSFLLLDALAFAKTALHPRLPTQLIALALALQTIAELELSLIPTLALATAPMDARSPIKFETLDAIAFATLLALPLEFEIQVQLFVDVSARIERVLLTTRSTILLAFADATLLPVIAPTDNNSYPHLALATKAALETGNWILMDFALSATKPNLDVTQLRNSITLLALVFAPVLFATWNKMVFSLIQPNHALA